jgi:hypothetical protein
VNWPPRRKATIAYKFAELFSHLPKRAVEVGRKLDEALEGLVDQSQSTPAGFSNAIPPQIVAGDPGSAGAEGAGWVSATARAPISTASPGNPTGKAASEGSGGALMRAGATIKQGIVTTKGDLLSHDGATAERLPVGTVNQVLVPDSVWPLGMTWKDLGPLIPAATPTFPTQKTAAAGIAATFIRSDAWIRQGIVTAKGDVLTHDGSTAERLAVGAAAQVLMVDGSTATGLKWSTVPTTAWWRQFMLMGG